MCECGKLQVSEGRMMEEVSAIMAYDSHVMEQMSEDEILACLVGETGPIFTLTHTTYSSV